MGTKNSKLTKGIGVLVLSALLVSGCTAVNSTKTSKTESSTSQSSEGNQVTKHTHSHNDEFKDDEVQDRTLEDWTGDWQSVYPYLLDGTLDEVLKHKAEENKDKSFDEYKQYYTTGYQTDTQRIVIQGNTIEFFNGNTSQKAEYHYDGYRILTYESGKKGVRYLFSKTDGDNDAPKTIQFSDHLIKPTKTEHFHLYFGNQSHEDLLKELENWPTYYKSTLSGSELVREMLHQH